MLIATSGDMARIFQTSLRNTALRTEGEFLQTELASGVRRDAGRGQGGDVTVISGIESSLTRLAAHNRTATEAAGLAGAQQLALDLVAGASERSAVQFAEASTGVGGAQVLRSAITSGGNAFASAASALNTRAFDRTLFAGAATQSSAVTSPEAMVVALQADLAGETTATGAWARIEAWFAPGGGFDTAGYTGAVDPMSPFDIGQGDDVQLTVTAADPTLRETLAGLAAAAVLADGALAGDPDQKAELLGLAGNALMKSNDRLVDLRAAVGVTEERIDMAMTRNSTEMSGLQIARNDLNGADPFETATRLEDVRARLELFYAATSRMSRLSLAEYLR